MARFPKTLGDILAAQSSMGRDLGTTALSTPELAPLDLGNFQEQVKTDLETAMEDVKQIDSKIVTAINDSLAIPLTDERFNENSLTVWPFIEKAIPKGAFQQGAVTGADLEDFSIQVKKLKDNRHHLY